MPCSEEALIDSMYDVIMDLALDLTIKKAGCEGTRKHFETIGYFFSHISENGVKVSESPTMGYFTVCLRTINNNNNNKTHRSIM